MSDHDQKTSKPQHEGDAQEAVGEKGPTPRPPMTKQQIREAVSEVADLLVFPAGEQKARKEMKLKYGWSAQRTNRVIQRVFLSWQRQDELNRKHQKAQAIRRLEGHIQAALARKSFNAVASFEAQLAKIQGTEQPSIVKVDVALGEAVAGVLAGMDVKTMKELAQEYDRLHERAAKALPEPIADAEIVSGDDEFKSPE